MSRRKAFTGFVMVALIATAAAAALASDTTTDRLRQHVETLTRPEMEGRRVGTRGHDLARDYIAEQFASVGLEPAGADGWFTRSSVVWNADMARATELRIAGELLARGVDYRPLGFSDDETVAADIVFVGYGVSDPHRGWDDYAELDVSGKIVIALTDGPRGFELPSSQLTDDAKAATALAKGAVGFLLVHSPRNYGDRPEQRPDDLGRMRASEELDGLAAGKLTRRAGTRVFESLGLDIDALQARMDSSGETSAQSLGAGRRAEMTLAVDRDRAEVDNVVGRVPGDATGKPIVLGAHYDHLGEGIAGSLWDGKPMLHPGADDNASGVAVIIEAARHLAKSEPNRPVYVVATTAEEVGLRGARHLANTFVRADRGTFINLDMVGRLRDPGLRVLGLEHAASITDDVRSAAESAGITTVESKLYDSPSDHIAFSEAGFRAIHLTTGRHPDYHQPTDTIDALNFDGMERVTQFVTLVVSSLAE